MFASMTEAVTVAADPACGKTPLEGSRWGKSTNTPSLSNAEVTRESIILFTYKPCVTCMQNDDGKKPMYDACDLPDGTEQRDDSKKELFYVVRELTVRPLQFECQRANGKAFTTPGRKESERIAIDE